jgi:hypothetical protein
MEEPELSALGPWTVDDFRRIALTGHVDHALQYRSICRKWIESMSNPTRSTDGETGDGADSDSTAHLDGVSIGGDSACWAVGTTTPLLCLAREGSAELREGGGLVLLGSILTFQRHNPYAVAFAVEVLLQFRLGTGFVRHRGYLPRIDTSALVAPIFDIFEDTATNAGWGLVQHASTKGYLLAPENVQTNKTDFAELPSRASIVLGTLLLLMDSVCSRVCPNSTSTSVGAEPIPVVAPPPASGFWSKVTKALKEWTLNQVGFSLHRLASSSFSASPEGNGAALQAILSPDSIQSIGTQTQSSSSSAQPTLESLIRMELTAMGELLAVTVLSCTRALNAIPVNVAQLTPMLAQQVDHINDLISLILGLLLSASTSTFPVHVQRIVSAALSVLELPRTSVESKSLACRLLADGYSRRWIGAEDSHVQVILTACRMHQGEQTFTPFFIQVLAWVKVILWSRRPLISLHEMENILTWLDSCFLVFSDEPAGAGGSSSSAGGIPVLSIGRWMTPLPVVSDLKEANGNPIRTAHESSPELLTRNPWVLDGLVGVVGEWFDQIPQLEQAIRMDIQAQGRLRLGAEWDPKEGLIAGLRLQLQGIHGRLQRLLWCALHHLLRLMVQTEGLTLETSWGDSMLKAFAAPKDTLQAEGGVLWRTVEWVTSALSGNRDGNVEVVSPANTLLNNVLRLLDRFALHIDSAANMDPWGCWSVTAFSPAAEAIISRVQPRLLHYFLLLSMSAPSRGKGLEIQSVVNLDSSTSSIVANHLKDGAGMLIPSTTLYHFLLSGTQLLGFTSTHTLITGHDPYSTLLWQTYLLVLSQLKQTVQSLWKQAKAADLLQSTEAPRSTGEPATSLTIMAQQREWLRLKRARNVEQVLSALVQHLRQPPAPTQPGESQQDGLGSATPGNEKDGLYSSAPTKTATTLFQQSYCPIPPALHMRMAQELAEAALSLLAKYPSPMTDSALLSTLVGICRPRRLLEDLTPEAQATMWKWLLNPFQTSGTLTPTGSGSCSTAASANGLRPPILNPLSFQLDDWRIIGTAVSRHTGWIYNDGCVGEVLGWLDIPIAQENLLTNYPTTTSSDESIPVVRLDEREKRISVQSSTPTTSIPPLTLLQIVLRNRFDLWMSAQLHEDRRRCKAALLCLGYRSRRKIQSGTPTPPLLSLSLPLPRHVLRLIFRYLLPTLDSLSPKDFLSRILLQ